MLRDLTKQESHGCQFFRYCGAVSQFPPWQRFHGDDYVEGDGDHPGHWPHGGDAQRVCVHDIGAS